MQGVGHYRNRTPKCYDAPVRCRSRPHDLLFSLISLLHFFFLSWAAASSYGKAHMEYSSIAAAEPSTCLSQALMQRAEMGVCRGVVVLEDDDKVVCATGSARACWIATLPSLQEHRQQASKHARGGHSDGTCATSSMLQQRWWCYGNRDAPVMATTTPSTLRWATAMSSMLQWVTAKSPML